MFDFDELGEVEAREEREAPAPPRPYPAAPARPAAPPSSFAGVDTRLSGRIDLAALDAPEETAAAARPPPAAAPRPAPAPPRPVPVPAAAAARTDAGEGGGLQGHVAAIVAASSDLRAITPKSVLQALAKRLGQPASELRPQLRLIQELARTEIQRRVAAVQAGAIEVPRFSRPPPGGHRALDSRRALKEGSPEACAAALVAGGEPAAAAALLADALEAAADNGQRAALLLLRGHVYWRDSHYTQALKDFEEAERLQPGGVAGPSLLALRHCLGLDLEAETVRGHAEAKQLLTEAAAIHRAGSDAVAAARHLFRPRAAEPLRDCDGEPTWAVPGMRIFDGHLEVEGSGGYPSATIGYRLLKNEDAPLHRAPLLVYYHGNGEVVSDYTGWADVYQKFPCSFLAFDYRAYGWSTGEAVAGCLTKDPVACMRKLPELLRRHGMPWPWPAPLVLMGRSLGSVVVGSLIAKFPDMFDGLIIESGVASTKEQRYHELLNWSGEHAKEAEEALERLRDLVAEGLPEGWEPGQELVAPLGTCDGVRGYRGPVLVLHGVRDSIVPFENAQRHYEAAANARERELVEIDGDHNDCAGVAEFWRKQMLFVRRIVEYKEGQQG